MHDLSEAGKNEVKTEERLLLLGQPTARRTGAWGCRELSRATLEKKKKSPNKGEQSSEVKDVNPDGTA